MPEYRIGFSRRRNPLAVAIRLVTASEVSHCYLRRIDGDSDEVFEATGGLRVSTRPYSVFLSHHNEVCAEYRVCVLAPVMLDNAWRWCRDHLTDRPYAWWQLPGDLWCELGEAVTGRRPRNPLAQGRALVCSELVLLWLRRAGLRGFARLDPQSVTAQDLLEIISDDSAQFAKVVLP